MNVNDLIKELSKINEEFIKQYVEDKEFIIKVVTPFGKAKVCSWKAASANDAVKEFVDLNPAYRENKKGAVIAESAQKNETVTKDNIDKIVSILSNIINKASKSYPEARLVTNYQATTGSDGTFLDKGLLFRGKDAYRKAVKVSEELQKAMKSYEFEEDIGGALPYMLLDKKHQVIVTFGSQLQGNSGAVVGFHILKSNLRQLSENIIDDKFQKGDEVKVFGRLGKVLKVRGDVLDIEFPADHQNMARSDSYYKQEVQKV